MKTCVSKIQFPEFSGIRCLMMPYIQGDPSSVPEQYSAYAEIIRDVFIKKGDIGFLTIDESFAKQGKPHRGTRATTDRAIHTEAGRRPGAVFAWGDIKPIGKPRSHVNKTKDRTKKRDGKTKEQPRMQEGNWGGSNIVTLERDVQILLANNIDDSCAIWDAEHEDTSLDGDLGHVAQHYPYASAQLMKAGDVHQIGILTPHESLPLRRDSNRQFLRILSAGVHGRESYFTINPLMTH
jgi:hypothetical protein